MKKLIAGPTVYICDECIGLCNDIIAEEVEKEEPYAGSAPIPKPSEIKAILDDYVIGQDRAKKILAKATGHSVERIEKDCDRDNFMSSLEAKQYGLIDEVYTRKPTTTPSPEKK